METVSDKLREIIGKKGYDYLADKPYKVFKELVDSGAADTKTAGAVFCFLVNRLPESVIVGSDVGTLSSEIQEKCGLNQEMADTVAGIFLEVYSSENRDEWARSEMQGAREFLSESWTFSWEGLAYWDYGTGGCDCHYNARIELMPTEESLSEKKIADKLRKNPFMSREDIRGYFEKSLKEYLDYAFEDYCTCDDYYAPVSEDFEIEYDLEHEWCPKNGFELVSCEGDGYTDDYEPKLWDGGW